MHISIRLHNCGSFSCRLKVFFLDGERDSINQDKFLSFDHFVSFLDIEGKYLSAVLGSYADGRKLEHSVCVRFITLA